MRFAIKATETDQLRTTYWSDIGPKFTRDWSGEAEDAIGFSSREDAEKYLATNPHLLSPEMAERIEIVQIAE